MKFFDDQKFIKEECSKCKNRKSDKDLCCIIRKIDGSYDCENREIEEKKELK